MSVKIFNNFICKSIKNPKHFHLYPSHRYVDKNAIFTKFGDDGKSKVHSGELAKDHILFEAIGSTEELNSILGLAREFARDDEKLAPLAEKLIKIQLVLVDIVDIISGLIPLDSTVDNTKAPLKTTAAKVTVRDINDLEALIAHYATLLPPVEKIVIPGGGKGSSMLHIARAVCRRCERSLVAVFKNVESEKNILAYMNRLSSYLFQAARISAKFSHRTETIYKPLVKEENPSETK